VQRSPEMNPSPMNPERSNTLQSIKSLRCLYCDPQQEQRPLHAVKALMEEVTPLRSTQSLLDRCRPEANPPELIILVERETAYDAYRSLLEKLRLLNSDCSVVYLYDEEPLFVKEFARHNLSFFSYRHFAVFIPTFRNYLRGILYRKTALNYRTKVEELEQKIATIGESYRKEREGVERQLKMKETWFASMVHELRTPVTGILGLSEILAQSKLDNDQRLKLEQIQNSGQILLGLVNDLLDFSKLQSGKMELEEIKFDLNEVLDKVASAIGYQAESKGLRLIFDIDKRVPAKIVGDPLRLSQVLINLLNNAVKFTEKGEITLKISMKNMDEETIRLLFEVIDTGIGLDSTQQQNLFKSFSQADSSVSRKYGGTGLGLMISKQIIEKMGGTIGVESEPGKGSRFFFELTTQRTERRSYRLPSRDLMFKKVLIIDENPHAASALARMLRYFHYGTTIASDEQELHEILEKQEFDIVIVDESLYSLCNVSCLRKIGDAFLVLQRSNFTGLEQSQKLKSGRFDAILQKPVTQRKVFEMILDLYAEEGKKHEENTIEIFREKFRERRGDRVLVADDNAINQAVIMGLLSKIGLEGILASNGQEALDILKSGEKIDLILMDINMPVMNGIEATKMIRQSKEAFATLPIVALTADWMDEKRLKELDIQGHLSKPIDVEHFYETLVRYLPIKKKPTSEKSYYMEKYGFDVKKGIARAGSNRELYCHMLENFLNLAIKTCSEIEERLIWKETPEVLRQLRLLISAAHNVLAMRIHQVAEKIYQLISNDRTTEVNEECTKLTAYLHDSLDRLEEAKLQHIIDKKQEKKLPQGDDILFEKKIRELLNGVRESRLFHCNKYLQELQKFWWSPKQEKYLADIEKLLKEQKLKELESLLSEKILEANENLSIEKNTGGVEGNRTPVLKQPEP